MAGDPFEPELAAAAAGVPRRPRSTRSTSCCARPRPPHRRARAASASATRSCARAVYEAAPGGWRLGAHERAAAALAARGAPARARAHHVERSGPPRRHGRRRGPARGGRGGGGARAGHAPRACSAAALRTARPTRAPAERAAAARRPRRRARRRRAIRRGPRRAAREPRRCAGRAPPGARVRLTAACASLENLIGRHQEAARTAHAALDELPDPASPGGGGADDRARVSTASSAWTTARCSDCARRALEAARTLGTGGRRHGGGSPRVRTRARRRVRRRPAATAPRPLRSSTRCPTTSSPSARARGQQPGRAPSSTWTATRTPAARRARARGRGATGQGQFLPILFWTGHHPDGAAAASPEAAEIQEHRGRGGAAVRPRAGPRLEPLRPLARGDRAGDDRGGARAAPRRPSRPLARTRGRQLPVDVGALRARRRAARGRRGRARARRCCSRRAAARSCRGCRPAGGRGVRAA